MNRSLKARMIWMMWFLSALVCLVTILISTFLIVRTVDENAKERIRAEQANLVALGLVDLISLNAFHDIVPRLSETLQADRLNEIIRIYVPPGRLVYSTSKQPDFDRRPIDHAKFLNKDFYLIQGLTQDYLALIRSHSTLENRTLWVEIATPRRKTTKVLMNTSIPFLVVFNLLLIISFLLAGYLTQWGLKPLETVSQQIEKLNPSLFKTWDPLSISDHPVEFRKVVHKIDQLLQRTQTSLLRTQQMSQFVAHEIRTPLTILRGEIESALIAPSIEKDDIQNIFQSALEEVERIENTVKIVLSLGRGTRGERVWNPKRIDIRNLLSELLARYKTWTHRDIELTSSKPELQFVYADPEILDLLIGNLIRNIAKHTPLHTPAYLQLEDAGPNQVSIILSDSGPGLPPDILQEANEKNGREGLLGVGLTLCKEIATVGRLGLSFHNKPTGGLTVTVTLPIAPLDEQSR